MQIIINSLTNEIVTEEEVNNLPSLLRKYAEYSGIVGKEKIRKVELKQKGLFKTKPDGKWLKFKAHQEIDTRNSSFVWKAWITVLKVVDRFVDNKGSLIIRLFGLIPLAKSEGKEIDEGEALRFLSELPWYPTIIADKKVTWKEINDLAAEAVFKISDLEVSALFYFNESGEIIKIEADRYFKDGKNFRLEKWNGIWDNYRLINGIKIPTTCQVIWKLAEGDFTYFKLNDLEYKIL